MNLKEFDAKQFLLEKGEQVGLGIALTLMVLMLIFSLFMPSRGFFSGSPAEKAKALKDGTEQLETALRSRPLPDNEKPEPPEGRLTNLDTNYLLPKNYEVLGFFEPALKESPERRPPSILNIEEAIVADAHVLIDTYLFSSDFKRIWVLRDSDRQKQPAGGAANAANPFNQYKNMRGGPGAMAGGPGAGGRMMGPPGGLQGLRGPASNDAEEYKPTLISVEDWNPGELTARQPRPLRVAVIGGSFPYRKQLEEFKKKLHLPDVNAVLNEDSSDKQSKSFDFRGVEVQRVEVDANDKPIGEWSDLALAEHYQNWLKLSFWPFQSEDPKYDLVKIEGLWAPLLREFHPDKKVDPTMRMMPPGQMGPGIGGSPSVGARPAEAAPAEQKSSYPDVVAKLSKLQDTLKKLGDVQPAQIATPKTKPGDYKFDPFRPNAAPPSNDAQLKTNTNDPNATQDYIPEYVLVRAVDVDLQPGKRYRYRIRIKMANPNYMRSDVASPEYKVDEILKSQRWVEINKTISLPPELYYYAVDEKQGTTRKDAPRRESARYGMWGAVPSDHVVFQFHRWIEDTPLSRKENEVVPVGDWAIADRVFVARGEYVGRKVRVDLPIWKFMQNAYVLPAEEQKGVSLRKRTTGLDVDFGFDNSPRDTILIDFEGGRVVSSSPKMDDYARTEVLMLSPDGKLLARNSATDSDDSARSARREKVFKRIEDVREGKGAE